MQINFVIIHALHRYLVEAIHKHITQIITSIEPFGANYVEMACTDELVVFLYYIFNPAILKQLCF